MKIIQKIKETAKSGVAVLAAFALLLVAPICAKAQVPKFNASPSLVYTSAASGISNQVSLGAVSNIDTHVQRNVAISIVSVAGASSTGNVGFTFTPCVDGTTNTMMTNLNQTVVQALNGTTPVYWGTNLDSFGYYSWLITAYTNSAGSVNVTNTLKYGNKISTP